MKPRCTRRDFIRISTGTAVSTAMLGSLPLWQRALAQTSGASTTGYKALVCLYLTGGNDGFNWIIPLTNNGPGGIGYNAYSISRDGSISGTGLALPQTGTGAPLLLQGTGTTAVTASDGNQYGIHPGCPELQALFNSGNLAVLANVGTLVQPTTQQTVNTVTLPPQLFSHIDQLTQWQTSIPNNPADIGWAGRIADLYAEQGYTTKLAMNIDVGGANTLQQGAQTNMYVIGTSTGGNAAPVLDDTSNTGYRNDLRASTAAALLTVAASDPSLLIQQYAAVAASAAAKVTIVNNALSPITSINVGGTAVTSFPAFAEDGGLGAQLYQVARIIQAQSTLGDARQIFFVSIGGFDTHNSEAATQAMLLPIVSQNINTFFQALVGMNQQNNVTLFTATEFGRTLSSNGGGADHAWGNHHVIVGGAVKGGQFYGTMPNLTIGGPDDFSATAGLGQMIPTTSTDQYAATLATWFGVPTASLVTLFPNLANFSTQTLSFMG